MSFTLVEIGKALTDVSREPELSSALDKLDLPIVLTAAGQTMFARLSSASDQPGIRLDASAQTWQETFNQYPAPGFQSIGALYRLRQDFSVAGSALAFMQSLPTMERLIERARETLNNNTQPTITSDDLASITGRYVKQAGAWIYVETAGNPQKPTICLLHTAGADSRQWHGLMSMPALQADWHMVAFDMPGHGRSGLAPGIENWQWRLTEDDYRRTVRDFVSTQCQPPVILMGCSMGSAIGLSLLAKDPSLFRAAILLEAPYHAPGRRSPYLDHPKVHGARLAATWVSSLLSPRSPAWRRKLATWIYSQSAPSVYDGDLAFYSDEFHAAQHTAAINTSVTPLWLLTGDYDYSASPDDTRKVAEEIPGSHFQEMPGFGHFPMTEDPDRLYALYLKCILEQIAPNIV